MNRNPKHSILHTLYSFRLFRRRLTFIGIFLLISATPAVVYLMRLAPAIKAADVLLSFNEGSGNSVADTNSTVSSGSITGAGWQPESMCRFGTCLYFDGADWISFGDESTFDFAAATDFTIEFWFRHGPASAAEVILQKYEGTGSDGGFRIQMESDGDISFGVDDSNDGFTDDSISSTTANYDDNQWHFVSAVKDGTTGIYLYIDSKLVVSDAAIGSTGTLANNDTFFVGDSNGADGGDEFIGFLDEIKIYTTTARTQPEINADYQGTTTSRGTAVSFSPQHQNLTNGLVGYWPLDESTTPSLDLSGDGNSGTWNDDTAAVGGKYGQATTLDGTGDFIAISNSTELQMTGAMTLAAWVKVAPTGQGQIIAKQGDNGARSYNLKFNQSNARATFGIATDANTNVTLDYEYTWTDTWQHLAATYEPGQEMAIFVNGVKVANRTNAVPSSQYSSTEDVNIGKRNGGTTNYLTGDVDEARIYNRALTAAEIEQLYQWAPGPVGHWTFDDNNGAPGSVSDMLVYRQGTDDRPVYRPHSTIWASAGFAEDIDSENLYDIQWVTVVSNPSPTSGEKILCTMDSGSDANCQVWNGSTWGSLEQRSASANSNKGIDIAYEQKSGQAIACYTDDDSPDNSIPYCDIWDGIDWNTPADANDVTGSPQNLHLIPDPNSDYIALITEDTADDINVQLWNGSSWGNLQEMETEGSTNNNDTSAWGAWDQNGDFMIVWYDGIVDTDGDPGNELQARKFDKNDGWGSQIDNVITGLSVTAIAQVKVAAHPYNGTIIAAVAADDSDVDAAYWNGSSWTGQVELEDALSSAPALGTQYVNLQFEHGGDYDAVIVYGASSSTLKNRVFDSATNAWSPEYSLPNSSDTSVDWLQLAADPTSDHLMLVVLGSVNDVDTLEWNGDVWEDSMTNQETGSDDQNWNAWFAYDYNPGNALDRTPNANHASMPPTMNDADWIPGKFGTAIELDGSNDYALVASPSGLPTGDVPRSIAAWFKTSDSTSSNNIGGFGYNSAGASFQVGTYEDGASEGWYVWGWGSDWDTGLSNDDYTDGEWHHVEVTYDGTSTKIYFDGIEKASTTSNSWTTDPQRVVIGDEIDLVGQPFNGAIDDFRIYNYARSAYQIVEDMNGGHPSPGSPIGSPVVYYRFDEGYGDSANDSSPQGNTGDLAGSGGSCPGAANCPTWTTEGKFDKSLSFDSSNDYVHAGTDASLNLDTGTWGGWIKLNDTGTRRFIFKENSSNARIFELFHNTDFSGRFEAEILVGSSTYEVFTTNARLDTTSGVWYHVMATYDGEALKLYVNGELQGTNNSPSGNLDDSAGGTLGIGASVSNPTTSPCYCTLDEIKIYNFALTADQINVEYNQGRTSVMGSTSTDTSGNATWSANEAYCPPGQGSACTAPVIEWSLDENANSTAQDITGNEKSGTLTNSPQYTPGKCGSGINLSASTSDNDHITRTDDSDLDFAAGGSFTLETWFKHDTASAQQVILSKYNEAGYKLIMESDGDITCGIDYDSTWSPADSVTSTSADYDDNTWHHIACVKNADTILTLYVDGVSVGTPDSSLTNSTLENSDPFYYGIDADGTTGDFIGQLDHLRIFNFARTSAQVAWGYNRGAPIGWWKLDENTDTAANDSSGNSFTGTLANGPTWVEGKFQYGVNFDGGAGPNADVITLGDQSAFELTTFTVMGWIYRTGSCQFNTCPIFSKGMSSGVGYSLELVDSSGYKARISIKDGTQEVTGTTTTGTNTWHHIAASIDGTTIKLYVDGRLEQKVTQTQTPTFGTEVAKIGNRNSNTDITTNGRIDDVRIYNYVLTDQQILEAINLGSVNFAPAQGAP